MVINDVRMIDALLQPEALLSKKLFLYTGKTFKTASSLEEIKQQYAEQSHIVTTLVSPEITTFFPDWDGMPTAMFKDWTGEKQRGIEDSDGAALGEIAIGHQRLIHLIPELAQHVTSDCAQILQRFSDRHVVMLERILSLSCPSPGF